jgi:hypothetical protein
MGHPWLDHMAKTRLKYPDVKNMGKLAALAKKTWKKGQSGGSALGGALSPESVAPGMSSSGGAALQLEATQYSGGKSRRKRSSSKKRGGSKKRSNKKRGSKRRH